MGPEKNTPQLKGTASAEKIAEWKQKNPVITWIKTNGSIGYFKRPNLDDLNYAYSKQDANKAFDKWKALAEVTWLGGDEELLTNDRLFVSIVDKIQDMAAGYESEMGEL